MTTALLLLFVMYIFKQKGMNSAVYSRQEDITDRYHNICSIIFQAILYSPNHFAGCSDHRCELSSLFYWAVCGNDDHGETPSPLKGKTKLPETSVGSEFHWSSFYQVVIANLAFNQWLWILQIILHNLHCRKFVKTGYIWIFAPLLPKSVKSPEFLRGFCVLD